jgi:hypothetical protein
MTEAQSNARRQLPQPGNHPTVGMPNRRATVQWSTPHRLSCVARMLPLASMGILRVRSEARDRLHDRVEPHFDGRAHRRGRDTTGLVEGWPRFTNLRDFAQTRRNRPFLRFNRRMTRGKATAWVTAASIATDDRSGPCHPDARSDRRGALQTAENGMQSNSGTSAARGGRCRGDGGGRRRRETSWFDSRQRHAVSARAAIRT